MGFLKRLFGDATEKAPTEPPRPADRPAWMEGDFQVTICDGPRLFKVVGESHYQDEFRMIVEEQGRDNAFVLVPEMDYSFDRNAISVWAFGLKVGYLRREDAAIYRAGILQLMEEEKRPLALKGRISGGIKSQPAHKLRLNFDPEDFGGREAAERAAAGEVSPLRTSPGTIWQEQVPLDRVAAVKFLRDRLARETNPFDRHFMYLELETTLYKSRDVFASAIDEYAETAEAHDAEMDTIRPALMAEFGGIPTLPTYKQMAIVEQKKHDYEAALDWAKRGLAVYGNDALGDDRVEDLKVRIGKYEAKLDRDQN